MKAPDKIFLVAPSDSQYESAEWLEHGCADTHNTEYIRKGALLERLAGFRDGSDYRNFLISDLIDKLNSM